VSELVKYRVLEPVTFHAGATLGLTEAQADARRYGLKALGKGLHQVVTPVQFKRGEEIGVQELPKALAGSVQEVTKGMTAAAQSIANVQASALKPGAQKSLA